MKDKFKVGDLIKLSSGIEAGNGDKFGIVLEIGIDYPNTGNRRCRYAYIRWSHGQTYRIYQDYGNAFYEAEVIRTCKNLKKAI